MIEVSQSDIDFYHRKIQNLQEDNIYLHEEIVRLRARLRTAQDYQIKYTLFLNSHQKEIQKIKSNIQKQEQAKTQDLLNAKLAESDQRWKMQFYQFQQQHQNHAQQELELLQKELSDKTKQLNDIKEKSQEIQFITFRMNKVDKQNQNLKEDIQQMKTFYEQQRTQQINQIRITLNNTYREKIDLQKKKALQKIIDLQTRLNTLQMQDDNQTYVVSDATNRELTSLKQLLDSKQQQYIKEVNELTQIVNHKNQQIKGYLEEHSRNYETHRQQIDSKNQYITHLQQKVLERQKQHQIQLLNLIERLNSLKEEEHQELNKQISALRESLEKMEELEHQRELSHQQEMYQLSRKMEDERKRFTEDKNNHKRKISELSSRIKEVEEDKQNCESQAISSSLRDIDGKQDQMANYQNGIVFLQRQYKKCQFKLEQKTKTVSKLYKDMNNLREQTDKEVQQLKQKIRNDKKSYETRILSLQRQVQDLGERVKAQHKQQARRQREIQKQRVDYQQQIKSLKEYSDELTRDYNRVIEDRKGVQANYREQRERSFTSKSDLNQIKQQKWLQLEKQKNQLHIIFKQKEEQIKIQYQQLLDDRNNQINKLKQELQILRKENELLKDNNAKLMQNLESNEQSNKLAEYNKKIASLNLEISLTQNIYQSLVKAKSRITHPHLNDIQQQSNDQPLQISFS